MGVTTLDTAYRLSPMQQGMLLHNLDAPQSGAFVQQTVFAVHGDLDPDSPRKVPTNVIIMAVMVIVVILYLLGR